LKHPEGEDINSLSVGHEKKIFIHLLESRKEVSSFFFSNEKSSDEKKKVIDPPSTVENPINTSNPNKITYTTSTAQYQILGGLRKGFGQYESKPDDPEPQQQPEAPQQAGLV
jgi:hypothetical protein